MRCQKQTEGAAKADAARIAALQTRIEQACADQRLQRLFEDRFQMRATVKQLLPKGLAERRGIQTKHRAQG